MRKLSEAEGLARLQRRKSAFQSHVKTTYEPLARDCRICPTPGVCCTDAHFVNVHITRLEAVAIRRTLERTPRLNDRDVSSVYSRARAAVVKYRLVSNWDSFSQTYSCPLFEPGIGCLVHRRAKPAPCIQHACYDRWEDVPPLGLQWREERRIEQLNHEVYGWAWAWLPIPVWLTLIDPAGDGSELERISRVWETRRNHGTDHQSRLRNRTLPVLRT